MYDPRRKVEEAEIQPRGEPTPDIRNPGSKHGYDHWHAAVRYRFCVHIDEAALQSIVSPEGEECYGDAWLSLIEADWDSEEAATQRGEDRIEHLESRGDPAESEDRVEWSPEVDGCVEECWLDESAIQGIDLRIILVPSRSEYA